MKGPCLCGDPACAHCGPAQGYNLEWENECEEWQNWLHENSSAFPAVIQTLRGALPELLDIIHRAYMKGLTDGRQPYKK